MRSPHATSGERSVQRLVAPAPLAGEHETEVVLRTGEQLEGLDEAGDVLPGLEGPEKEQVAAAHAEAGEGRAIVAPGVGSVGRKRSWSTPCGMTTTSPAAREALGEALGGRGRLTTDRRAARRAA